VSTLRAEAIEVRAGTKALITDVSLAVEPGELLAVIGPNGAGKSTLLSALAGDRPLAKGDVLLDGKPMRRWNKRDLAKRRAVLPQHSNVAFDFTAAGRRLGLLAHRDRLSEPQMRAAEQARVTEARLRRPPHTVLSAMKPARAAARAVQCDAEPGHTPFLPLDEPIAGPDSPTSTPRRQRRRRADRGLGWRCRRPTWRRATPIGWRSWSGSITALGRTCDSSRLGCRRSLRPDRVLEAEEHGVRQSGPLEQTKSWRRRLSWCRRPDRAAE
jgi:iron complex transport system ATP-binding protein